MALATDPGMSRPSETLPRKTYYLELDGEPYCVSGVHPKATPTWTCGHGSHREAQEAALLVWRDHPDCVIAIREGPCPRGLEEDWADRWEDYDHE